MHHLVDAHTDFQPDSYSEMTWSIHWDILKADGRAIFLWIYARINKDAEIHGETQQNYMGKYTITMYYVTRDTKSITHGLTSYLRWRNKPLLYHRLNIKASAVETMSIWDMYTMPTPYLIIGESVVNQTKCLLVIVTTVYLLTTWTAFPALSTVIWMLLAGSYYRCTKVHKLTDSALLRDHRHF